VPVPPQKSKPDVVITAEWLTPNEACFMSLIGIFLGENTCFYYPIINL